MAQLETGPGIKTKTSNQQGDRQELERLAHLHVAFIKILPQPEKTKHKNEEHRYKDDVIEIIDADRPRKFGCERQPDGAEQHDAVIKIIINGQEQKHNGVSQNAGDPFAPVEWLKNDQRDPDQQKKINKRQVDQGPQGYDHTQVKSRRFRIFAFIKPQQFKKHPQYQEITDQRRAQYQKGCK